MLTKEIIAVFFRLSRLVRKKGTLFFESVPAGFLQSVTPFFLFFSRSSLLGKYLPSTMK